MKQKEIIQKNINNVLDVLDNASLPELAKLGERKKGKVRDIYEYKGDSLIFITTDRQSAFDRNLALVPYKGHVLTATSVFWFEQTKDIVKNHLLDYPDPNVMVGKKLTVFPVEFVVRGYLTGTTATSAWTAYAKGERDFCGHRLPEGMKKNQAFAKPLLTPTTKSEISDEKISAAEIIEINLMTAKQWAEASEIALALFQRGQEIAKKNGLILVDTKYELGFDAKGKIYLCDEIHTPDSSRYWLTDSYEQNLAENKEPRNIDKEFLRLWFKENCDPYRDKVLPTPPEELIVELSMRYIELYERITGKTFEMNDISNIPQRIVSNFKAKGYLS